MTNEHPREDGPTEVVETEDGELVERLSGGTATLLLTWLVGVGALTTLLAAWIYVWLVTGERLGVGALFGGFGVYTAVAGAAGPCVLWLTGRAQNHGLGWFLLTHLPVDGDGSWATSLAAEAFGGEVGIAEPAQTYEI